MGWLYSTEWQDKAAMIAHLTKDFKHKNQDGELTGTETVVIAKSLHGQRLWTVWEERMTDHTSRYIVLFLMNSHRVPGAYYDGWGYKDVSESMGPCEKDCPLKFFDMVPEVPEPYGAEWRKEVREYWDKKNADKRKVKSLKPGQIVKLTGEIRFRDGVTLTEVTLRSVSPLVGYGPNGGLYRLRPALIATQEATQ